MKRPHATGGTTWRDAILPPTRFSDASLERAFREAYVAKHLSSVQRGFLLAAVIVLAFCCVFAKSDLSSRQVTRIAILITLSAGAILISLRPRLARAHFEWAAGAPVVISLLLAATLNLQPSETSSSQSERIAPAIILALWLAYAFSRIRLSTLAIAALFASAIAFIGRALQSTSLMAIDATYLLAANIVGWTTAVQTYRHERAQFLHGENLERLAEALADEARSLEIALNRNCLFVRGMTHDLRQPLCSLTFYVNDLKGEMLRSVPSSARAVANVDACLSDLSKEIERMLLVASDRDAYRVPAVTPHPVATLLEGVVHLFERRAEAAGIRLVVRQTNSDLQLMTDQDVARRAVANLVDNALKYHRGEKDSGRFVLVRAVNLGQSVRVDVRDNGPGIEERDHEKIFDLYWRSAGVARNGFGIGLDWVRKSLSQIPNHRITAVSRPGKGARFSLYFPRCSEQGSERYVAQTTHDSAARAGELYEEGRAGA